MGRRGREGKGEEAKRSSERGSEGEAGLERERGWLLCDWLPRGTERRSGKPGCVLISWRRMIDSSGRKKKKKSRARRREIGWRRMIDSWGRRRKKKSRARRRGKQPCDCRRKAGQRREREKISLCELLSQMNV